MSDDISSRGCDWNHLGFTAQESTRQEWWQWTNEEVSLRNTLLINLICCCVALALYIPFQCSSFLRRELYAPRSTESAPTPYPWQAWHASLRDLLGPAPTSQMLGRTVEL